MAEIKTEIQKPARDANGRLLPGHHLGRPAGRSQADLVRMLIEPMREELIETLRTNSKSPDGTVSNNAAKTLLERLAPRPKEASERVHVPGLAEAQTLTAKAEAIVAAVATGEISAEAGERLIRLVGVLREVIAHDELEARIAALEVAKGIRQPRTITDGELA